MVMSHASYRAALPRIKTNRSKENAASSEVGICPVKGSLFAKKYPASVSVHSLKIELSETQQVKNSVDHGSGFGLMRSIRIQQRASRLIL